MTEDYETVIPANMKYVEFNGFLFPSNAGAGAHFFTEIARAINNNESAIINLVGKPGIGKSLFGTRMGQIIDPHFHVTEDSTLPSKEIELRIEAARDSKHKMYRVSNIVFSRDQLLYLLSESSPLKRGACILVDEVQYSLGARRWYESVQKDLMEAIESIRSRGFVIILVSLHPSLLDITLRKFMCNFLIVLEDRGKATVYKQYMLRFKDELHHSKFCTLKLQLPGYESCSSPTCLTCQHRSYCQNIRAIYERAKAKFVLGMTQNARNSAEIDQEKLQKRIPVSNETMIADLHENIALLDKKRGRVNILSIQKQLFDSFGQKVSIQRCYFLRTMLETAHPEDITAKADT